MSKHLHHHRATKETIDEEVVNTFSREILHNPGNSSRRAIRLAEAEIIHEYFPPDRGALLLLFLCSLAVCIIVLATGTWDVSF